MIIAVDTEATGLFPHRGDRPFAVSMTDYNGKDYYWRFEVDPLTRKVKYERQVVEYFEIQRMLSHPDWVYVFHNALFDLAMLKSIGIEVKGQICDTMLLADAVDNSRMSYALKPLSEALLGWDNTDESELHKSTARGRREARKQGWKIAEDLKADFHLADPELCKKYAIADTQRTMAIFKFYEHFWTGDKKELEGTALEHFVQRSRFEHSLIEPTLAMNMRGLRVHDDKLVELKGYYEGIIESARAKIVSLGYPDFNPRSAKQKQEIFYEELDMPEIKRRRKNKDGSVTVTRSVDKKALSSWANGDNGELAEVLLELTEAEKQLTGFVEPLSGLSIEEDGYRVIKASCNIVGAHATGRMSYSNPNLQNITTSTSPGRLSKIEFKLREAFGPRPDHYWILADYEQIEVINAAYLSGDKLLRDTIESGKSFHDITCHALFSHKPDYNDNRAKYRKQSKTINFAMFYGSGPKKLAETINCDIVEAARIWRQFWETYTGIKAFSDRLSEEVLEKGFVTDIFGRTYRTPPKAEYKAFNRIIQGTSAQIFKRAFKKAYEELTRCPIRAQVVACVHDEIIVEVANGANVEYVSGIIRDCMRQNFHELIGKPTPLDIGLSITTTNWNDKQEIKLD